MTFIVISELTITVEVDWGSMSLYFNWCWFGQGGKWYKLNHWLVSFGSFWSFGKNGLLIVFYTQFQRISFLRKMIHWQNLNKLSFNVSVNAVDSFKNKAFVKSVYNLYYIYGSVHVCIKAYFIHDCPLRFLVIRISVKAHHWIDAYSFYGP